MGAKGFLKGRGMGLNLRGGAGHILRLSADWNRSATGDETLIEVKFDSQIYSTFTIMMVNGYYDVNHFSVLSYFFFIMAFLNWKGSSVSPLFCPATALWFWPFLRGTPPAPQGRAFFPVENIMRLISKLFCLMSFADFPIVDQLLMRSLGDRKAFPNKRFQTSDFKITCCLKDQIDHYHIKTDCILYSAG